MERRAKILVVDDEEAPRGLMQYILEREGYEVSLANDGEEALERAEESPPDVILLDLNMPKMDGFEVMKRLKGDDRTMIIPIVIVTGLGEAKDRLRALKLGADDFLTKPVDTLELTARVRSLVKVKAYNDHMRDYQKELEVKVAERTGQLRKTHEELKRHRDHLEELVKERTFELANQRSRLEAIFGSVKDAIITVDSELRVLAANQITQDICGISPEEITGSVFTDCLDRCDRACHEVLKQTLESKATVKERQVECTHRARPKQTVMATSSPLLDREGTFMGAVLVIRDITRISDLERELRQRHTFRNMVGKSRKMQDIYELLEDLADVDTTVLITGESGTGKELVARALHHSGSRASGPMVTVNCSALAEDLLESELFGHVKGAFTGAIGNKEGRFQAAHKGTILLDEIGDISTRIQLRLLRVLQEKEFERVGESVSIKVDVRVITCTNQDLREKVRRGEFREDLYYRLKVVEVGLPPLRERPEDIPLLVDHFCEAFNREFGKNIEGLSDEVLRVFLEYPWRGNVRELENAMEHAFVLCRGRVIGLDQMPSEIREYSGTPWSVPDKVSVKGAQEVFEALNKSGWNKAKAARLLGINRRTLYKKLEKFKLSEPV